MTGDAGVVDQQLHVCRGRDGVANLRLVGHVERQRDDPSAVAGAERSEGVDVARGRVHLGRPSRDQGIHDGFADPAIGARHQGGSSCD